jgi:hypothetical protein
VSGDRFSYRIVKLANGSHSLHSLAEAETFHPVVGPTVEAEALYVRQLRLPQRAGQVEGEFVIWDVGLGAAANPVTFLRAASNVGARIRIISFDHTLEPLRFALQHPGYLPYLQDFEGPLGNLLAHGHSAFTHGKLEVDWTVHVADFPSLLADPVATVWPKPYAVMYDAFSPAKNPAMWTQPVFAGLYRLLDPMRPCAMPTYSRSTMLRVTLLLAGFYVGVGHATGEKEETTIAANTPDLLAEPLDRRWLQRAQRSHSAEPLWKPIYRQAPLSAESRERLHRHPQFAGSAVATIQ